MTTTMTTTMMTTTTTTIGKYSDDGESDDDEGDFNKVRRWIKTKTSFSLRTQKRFPSVGQVSFKELGAGVSSKRVNCVKEMRLGVKKWARGLERGCQV